MQKRPIIFCLPPSCLLRMGKDNWVIYVIKKSLYGENTFEVKSYNIAHSIKVAA